MTKKQLKKLGTVSELQKRFGRSRSTIYRWIREGPPKNIVISKPKKSKPLKVELTQREKSERKEQRKLYLEEQTRLRELTREKRVGVYYVPITKREIRERELQKKLALQEQERIRTLVEKARQIEVRAIRKAELTFREAIRKRNEELRAQFEKEHDIRRVTERRNLAIYKAFTKLNKRRDKLVRKDKDTSKIDRLIKVHLNWGAQISNGYEYYDDSEVYEMAELEGIDVRELFSEIYGYEPD